MRRYITIAAIALPVLVILVVVGLYASDEILADDRVSHGVSAEHIDLSRMSRPEAEAAIAAYEEQLASQPVEVIVEGTTLTVDPHDISFGIDESAIVTKALAVRRSSNGFVNFGRWIGSRFSRVELSIEPTIDADALNALMTRWDRTVIDHPAYDGAVIIDNGSPAPEYPQPGTRIDHDAASMLILAAASTEDRDSVELPLVDIEPSVTGDDVDAAVALATTLVSKPIVLRPEGETAALVFSPAGLTSALRSQIVTNSPPTVVPYLDREVIGAIAASQAAAFEVPAQDASFRFDEQTKEISVVPSRNGRTIDLDAIPDVVDAAARGRRSGTIPMKVGALPNLTTEAAEAMGPFGEVSTFTTRHPCCENRVVNIQLLADEIDGHWVMPGETFSINETAGKRTTAEGYRRAGAIIGGEVVCCDSPVNVGGGTSQFATTFYNAVFFGCYEDVFHQPHSLYFSRYPYVREATLGYPMPDVIFRNDSASVIYIETSYTPSSITVTFYGNNGGRTCESERSGNTITRVMTHPDGSVTKQSWTWSYRSKTQSTTTTTRPGTTTTTTGPGTTTTTAATTTTVTTPP
ncbi:MAG: VanW family protein [Acidimicrobiia bacterium]